MPNEENGKNFTKPLEKFREICYNIYRFFITVKYKKEI